MTRAVVLLAALALHPTHLDCTQQPAACQQSLAWGAKRRRHDAARIRELHRHLRRVHYPVAREAAFLAGQALHVNPWAMLRVGACETGGTYDPYAYNPTSGATGWLQFLSSTWRATPFAAWPRTNPYAQALAAAQIVRADGGYRQWSCGSAGR